jgi:hypothetical protein
LMPAIARPQAGLSPSAIPFVTRRRWFEAVLSRRRCAVISHIFSFFS